MTSRWIMTLGMGLLAAVVVAEEAPTLKGSKDKLSYALGMDLGNQLRKISVKVDPALFGQGLKDALSGSKTLLTEEEVRATISELQAELKMMSFEAQRRADEIKAAEKNQKAGEAFMAENGKKEGVVTLPSGLQYKILKPAGGKKPAIDDTIICHYRGIRLDGTEFYNSYTQNQPTTFAVKGGVIQGWSEALQLMPVGSKWQLFVPPQLAYGDRGAGGKIGPNETVIYEVELLAIK
jgi:FKBP-type peptidyl-prolyl cis-trans isomerase